MFVSASIYLKVVVFDELSILTAVPQRHGPNQSCSAVPKGSTKIRGKTKITMASIVQLKESLKIRFKQRLPKAHTLLRAECYIPQSN